MSRPLLQPAAPGEGGQRAHADQPGAADNIVSCKITQYNII